MLTDGLGQRLIEGWQREFPLVPRPFAELARTSGATEDQVIACLTGLAQSGVLSRVGATVRPNSVGASTLAALGAPPDRLEEIARIVSAEPGVNHNYEREHALNLWFVVTGRDREAVDAALGRLRRATGLAILDLPLERSYVVDLGFPVHRGGARWSPDQAALAADQRRRMLSRRPVARPASEGERRLLTALQDGLALVPRPYAALAEAAGETEPAAIAAIGRLIADGIISRFGLIVRHQELGYRANAMSVWDVGDADVDRVGALLAASPDVALCYRRPRRLPAWPYNLFCMLLGQEREAVLARVRALSRSAGIDGRPRDVLFSCRRFKQRGANLAAA